MPKFDTQPRSAFAAGPDVPFQPLPKRRKNVFHPAVSVTGGPT